MNNAVVPYKGSARKRQPTDKQLLAMTKENWQDLLDEAGWSRAEFMAKAHEATSAQVKGLLNDRKLRADTKRYLWGMLTRQIERNMRLAEQAAEEEALYVANLDQLVSMLQEEVEHWKAKNSEKLRAVEAETAAWKGVCEILAVQKHALEQQLAESVEQLRVAEAKTAEGEVRAQQAINLAQHFLEQLRVAEAEPPRPQQLN